MGGLQEVLCFYLPSADIIFFSRRLNYARFQTILKGGVRIRISIKSNSALSVAKAYFQLEFGAKFLERKNSLIKIVF